jgi:hypothetical protein
MRISQLSSQIQEYQQRRRESGGSEHRLQAECDRQATEGLDTRQREELERLLRERDQALHNWFRVQEERRSQRQQTATGAQSDESWAIREAARRRLAEQRQRERDAVRWQRRLQ